MGGSANGRIPGGSRAGGGPGEARGPGLIADTALSASPELAIEVAAGAAGETARTPRR
ncbi:MAG: hypothetical protein ACR2MP_11685 [Streptosporangiaceae bacterium]